MLGMILQSIETYENRVKMGELYAKHKNMMLHIAMGILQEQCLAEDAVQQSFLRINNNLNKLDSVSSEKTRSYLSIIIRNVSIDLYNKKKLQRANEISLDDIINQVALDLNIEDDYLLKTEIELLAKRINDLSYLYRDVFILRYYHDHSITEISEMLDISVNAIKKRLERVRKRLKGG